MSRLHNKAQLSGRQHSITTAGTAEHLGGYMTATTISFTANDGTADTIDDSASNFIKKGFRANDVVVITGSTSNNATYEVDTVTAGTLTLKLTNDPEVTTEAAGSSFTINAEVRVNEIDDGIKVLVKGHPDNAGRLLVGGSSADASDTEKQDILEAGQGNAYQVTNLKAIWVDVGTSADKVIIGYES